MTDQTAGHAPAGLLHRIAVNGTAGYPERTARRLRFLNIVSAVVVVLVGSYFVLYAAYDLAGLWAPTLVILLQCVLFACVPWWHRHGDMAGALFIVAVWLGCVFALSVLMGRDSGVHFYFLPGASWMLLIFDRRHYRMAAGLALVPLMLFLITELTQTMPASFVHAEARFLGLLYLMNMPGAYFLTFFMLFYAVTQTNRAEDALEKEYARSERLLGNLLPESIALRLKNAPEKIIADDLGQVTILFADIVDFTPRAARMAAPELVAFLNRVFTEFDKLAEAHGLEKIKTIGDAYMVAAGMPLPRDDHATAIADMALDMIAVTERITAETGESVAVRIGLHTGPAVAGVIGTRKFFYDVWGDTVNTAARMESQGEPGRIQVTPEARETLAAAFTFEERGEVEVKGKGRMTTYWLTGRKG